MKDGYVKLTADIIIEFEDGSIVLIKRKNDPFKNFWAIPGGKLEGTETIYETAIREAEEETGLTVELKELVGVYSSHNRDPRGRYVSVVFTAKPIGGKLKASSDATEYLKTKDYDSMNLAFDHNQIIIDYKNLNK